MKKITRPDLFGLLDEMSYTLESLQRKLESLRSVQTELISLTTGGLVDVPQAQDRIRELVKKSNLWLDSFSRMKRGIGKTSKELLRDRR